MWGGVKLLATIGVLVKLFRGGTCQWHGFFTIQDGGKDGHRIVKIDIYSS